MDFMEHPANLHRIAVLRHPRFMEQCVLAVAHGPVQGFVDDPIIGSDDFVAIEKFAKLGPGQWRTIDGRPFFVMPVTDEPTIHQSRWSPNRTAGDALAQLEAEKAKLIAAGWREHELDPVNDAD